MKRGSTAEKPARKTMETNRRAIMTNLFSQLASVIEGHTSTSEVASTHVGLLHEATSYIKKLKETVEELEEKKKKLEKGNQSKATSDGMVGGIVPTMQVRCQESLMEVVLRSGSNKRFLMHEVISVLEEEGAEIVSTNFFVLGKEIIPHYSLPGYFFKNWFGRNNHRREN